MRVVFRPAAQPEGVVNLIHLDGAMQEAIATDFNGLAFSPGGGLLTIRDGDEMRVMDLRRDTTTGMIGAGSASSLTPTRGSRCSFRKDARTASLRCRCSRTSRSRPSRTRIAGWA